MFKRNKIYTVVAASALITFSAMSTAQQSETSTASVVVSNSFTLTEVAPLNLGSLGVFQNLDVDGPGGTAAGIITTPAIYTVGGNGTTGISAATPGANTVSRIVEITPGAPAEIAVSNAVRFTDLTVSDPTVANLVDPNLDPTLGSFFTVEIDPADMVVNGGPNDGNLVTNSGTGMLRTDTNGNVGVFIGARISPNGAAAAILDGNYASTFSVTISY